MSEPTSAIHAGLEPVTERLASWVAGTRLDAVPEIVERFRALAVTVVEHERGAAIDRMVLGLDQLDDPGELISLLAAPVRPAVGSRDWKD